MKKYWTTPANERQEHPKVDAFIAEIAEVCRRHGLSISHEDGHGSFVIEPFDEYNVEWLSEASVALEKK